MQKRGSLAKTALAANVLVWGGAAVFLFALAGENTYAAFHGQWYNIVGWALICAVASAITIIGIREVRRLHSRLPG
ncbi:hypothetical protein B7R54_18690 [Subtercola boreus]|uniref:Uncharacterized protein n=1 Tax=Subtercola boreus TaxID=120213 RepID=A0A3E0V9T4_9MICO|nr:hypothetical protein [Subtercola boreus]RFA06411.1 hypothetical protein B7R54_18690 [Subtercola boreus]TQL46852.1 hypothetical protein FB464_3846 [Subtercola boreus]